MVDQRDPHHPSQAEGDDPDAPDAENVLGPRGRTSQAEGEDPDHPDEHEVIDPDDPA
jgi:hypothetical protein